MPNLKDLKNRIVSVKSTQKITKAMKLVAASKLRRAREVAEEATPYADRMERMISTLSNDTTSIDNMPLLTGTGVNNTYLLVVISSDRGLCGGFNISIVKEVKQTIARLQAENKEVKLYFIGKKAWEILKTTHADLIVGVTEGLSKKKKLNFFDADAEAEKVIHRFSNNEFDKCLIFYNKFLTAISQKPVSKQIIPVEAPAKDKSEDTATKLLYTYEPSAEKILNKLLSFNIAVQIYHALLENSASEQGARMTAMDNASRNAGDMIKRLTLVYNRTRQAAITKELIEIISGAEAL